jgi:hypothetical protein
MAAADEAWAPSPQRGVWTAYKHGLVLTVSRLVGGGYLGEIEGPGVRERSSSGTRLSAQQWCERRAESRRETRAGQ